MNLFEVTSLVFLVPRDLFVSYSTIPLLLHSIDAVCIWSPDMSFIRPFFQEKTFPLQPHGIISVSEKEKKKDRLTSSSTVPAMPSFTGLTDQYCPPALHLLISPLPWSPFPTDRIALLPPPCVLRYTTSPALGRRRIRPNPTTNRYPGVGGRSPVRSGSE